ncbi:MAG: hypothetical protein AABY30_00220 [Candidatus Thermoplasmatota archaeon]
MADPPSPRRNRALIVVLVLVVAAIVGASAYTILSAPPPPQPAPFVQLGSPQLLPPPGSASVRVEEVSREASAGLFRVDLRDVFAAREVFSAVLHAGTLFSNGTTEASFVDLTSPDRLGVGDVFRLENFPTGVTYSLTLVYAPEQRTVASVTIPL